MFLNTFPVVVCVHVSASVASVLNIYRHNVCTISIEMKSQHLKRAKIEKIREQFCAGGLGDPSSPTKSMLPPGSLLGLSS